jgi:hypothetical protein
MFCSFTRNLFGAMNFFEIFRSMDLLPFGSPDVSGTLRRYLLPSHETCAVAFR